MSSVSQAIRLVSHYSFRLMSIGPHHDVSVPQRDKGPEGLDFLGLKQIHPSLPPTHPSPIDLFRVTKLTILNTEYSTWKKSEELVSILEVYKALKSKLD